MLCCTVCEEEKYSFTNLRLGSVWILVCEECMVETAVQAPETKGPKGGKRGGKGKGGKRGG